MSVQREKKLGKFDLFRKLSCLENITNKFERLSHNLMGKKRSRDEQQIGIKQVMLTQKNSHAYCVI